MGSRNYFLPRLSSETVSFFLPFARRAASTRRPFAVDILSRKPCLFLRLVFEGWNVLFISITIYFYFFFKGCKNTLFLKSTNLWFNIFFNSSKKHFLKVGGKVNFYYYCFRFAKPVNYMIMDKKLSVVFVFIFLIFSNIVFSQTENPYAGFDPSALKKNAQYARNFAPNNYKPEIVYNCLTDMMDLARAQYRFLTPLGHNIQMDSTAQFQADYQAVKDEKLEDNLAPYKTLPYRLRKYGLSGNGIELVAKTKAYLGEVEYTYYDMCLSVMQGLLKNVKTADILLDKQYSLAGIGFNTDKMMKSMYFSIVLGNDRTLGYKTPIGARDLPYTKGMAGLKAYDDKVCKKCAAEPGLEVLSEYISVNKNGDVYLVCDDYKNLKRLIGKDGDGIALDFVQHSQYDCDDLTVDYDHAHRGTVTKPITYEKIFEANENTNLKSGKLMAKIGSVPESIELDKEMDINILVLKEGNYVCRTVLAKHIETKNADYTEKINFMKDMTGIKSTGEWVPSEEEGDFSITFPYVHKKTDYTCATFDSLLTLVDVPEYKLNKIEIIAHNSPNYYKDANYQKIQQKRADFLKKSMITKYPGVEITISYDYCWELFKKNIVNSGEYYDLSFLTLDEAAKQLKSDSYALKVLDSAYLAPCRYYEIKYYVTYPIETKEKEQKFVIWKFNNAMANKNKGLAMSIENYMIDQMEKGNYSADLLSDMNIPNKKEFQTLLNNRLYMQYYDENKMTPSIAKQMTTISNLNPGTPTMLFNTTVCDVFQTPIRSTADITKIQANIDKLYATPGISKEKVNSLNMEFQLKIINYLDTIPVTTETSALSAATFAKIKEIRNPKMDSWQNAYKLASYFVKKHDYSYALSLMDPFLDEKNIAEDFIFSYISIAAHREQTYLSPLFSKAVKMASERDIPRLCGLFDKLPICVLENETVRAIICKSCK